MRSLRTTDRSPSSHLSPSESDGTPKAPSWTKVSFWTKDAEAVEKALESFEVADLEIDMVKKSAN
jgi:hypothetical protein